MIVPPWGPAITCNASAASRASRASGPTDVFHSDVPRPMVGTRPRVVCTPTMPHHAAGRRVDPPPSVATAMGTIPVATPAALPALDDPGTRPTSHGLRG